MSDELWYRESGQRSLEISRVGVFSYVAHVSRIFALAKTSLSSVIGFSPLLRGLPGSGGWWGPALFKQGTVTAANPIRLNEIVPMLVFGGVYKGPIEQYDTPAPHCEKPQGDIICKIPTGIPIPPPLSCSRSMPALSNLQYRYYSNRSTFKL